MATRTRTTDRERCDCAPACPSCGGLECLCRPRWVAGQIVTEADLNRLDRYITGKQRLHNRQLFGTGVVCGLVVSCHACDSGSVRVSPGYALGPCGEDIVVCAPDTVDVCALIQRCRQREIECRPWGDDRGCTDLDQEWVLAIRYEERASRTEPRLGGSSSASCGCGGGCSCGKGGGGCSCGSKGGGCGCGGSGKKPAPRTSPAECAPRITCEGYRYEVFKAPKRNDDDRDRGALIERYRECFADLLAAYNAASLEQNPALACAKLKAALVAHYSEHATSHCEEVRQLCSIVCGQEPGPANAQLMTLLMGALQDCLCNVMLPPCAEPSDDPRLPLATFTVRGQPCKVLKVCNWTPLRPIVVTWPNLLYWLSIFPQLGQVRDLLHRLCCEPLFQRQAGIADLRPMMFAAAATHAEQPDIMHKWLFEGTPDPRDLLSPLGVAGTGEVAELRARIEKLELAQRPNG